MPNFSLPRTNVPSTSTPVTDLLRSRPAAPLQIEVLCCASFMRPKIDTFVSTNRYSSTSISQALVRPIDPFYLELAGVPAGATIEIVNRSAYPNGTFEHHAVKVKPTGYRYAADDQEPTTSPRRGKRGLAGTFLDEAAMAALQLSGNSKLDIRVIDAGGRVSNVVHATTSVNAADLPHAHRLDDVIRKKTSVSSSVASSSRVLGDAWSNGVRYNNVETTRSTNTVVTTKKTQFTTDAYSADLLEGPGWEQEVFVSDGWDNQPMTLVAKNVKLAARAGKLHVMLDAAVEPDAKVTMINSRTGSRVDGVAGWDAPLMLPLPDDVGTGDTLRFTVRDQISRSSVANDKEYVAVVDPSAPGGLRFAVDPSDSAPPVATGVYGGQIDAASGLPEGCSIPSTLKPGSFPIRT